MKMSSKITFKREQRNSRFFKRVGTEIKKDFRDIRNEIKEGFGVVREFFFGPRTVKYRKLSELQGARIRHE